MNTAEKRQEKAVNYPDETEGTRMGYKARRMASKLSKAERDLALREAMSVVYGKQPEEGTGAGH